MSLATNASTFMAGEPTVPTVPIWRITVDQYHEMIRTGILAEDDPVELLDGWLVAKMTKTPLHRTVTGLIRESLERLLPEGWYVDSQEPITLPASEPEPDVVIVQGERLRYLEHHPGPADLALVVEVADTSLPRDEAIKKRLYARAQVSVYWIVNLVEQKLEVYTDATGKGPQADYRSCRVYLPGEEAPVLIEGREIGRVAVRSMLPGS